MAELLQYKCPSCGGAIEFDSSAQKMKCPYCDTEFEMDVLKQYDEELKNEQDDEMSWETEPGCDWQEGETDGMRVYVCQSCGGEIVADETTAATKCPYCDNPVVMKGQFSGDLKPDYVIPFKYDKKAAKEAMLSHLSNKRLLPKAFKEENHIDEIKGIYVPFWLFDTDADANMRFRATRVKTWSDSEYNYTKTSHYMVFRAGDIGFEGVPVDGSSKMADDLMESIEPFYFKDAVDFETAYLAGYLADKYDVSAEDSIDRANARVRESTEKEFAATVVGYSTVVPEHTTIRLSNGTAKYALYPVWLLNTTWNNEHYTFAMNGQTGKFVGNLPMDMGAFLGWLVSLTGISAVVILILMYVLWLI